MRVNPFRMRWEVEREGYSIESGLKFMPDQRDCPFSFEWDVADFYRARSIPDEYKWRNGGEIYSGPWIVANRENGYNNPRKFYDPMEHRTLHRKFAALRPTHDGIIEFAEEFGLLGAYFENSVSMYPPFFDAAEPVEFWYDEIRFVLELLDLLEQSQDEELAHEYWLPIAKEQLEQLGWGVRHKEDGIDWGFFFVKHTRAVASYAKRFVIQTKSGHAFSNDLKYSDLARVKLESQLNTMLSLWVRPTIEAVPGSPLMLRPRNLLGAIYALFAEEIIGATRPIKKCPGCGKWFQPLDSRKKTCSDKCRQRTWRNEQDSKGKKDNG